MNESFSSMQSSQDILDKLSERYNLIRLSNEQIMGVESGYKKLDELLGGFQKGFLYVLGARPSVGKTAFCISMMKNMLLHETNPKSVVYFSLESSANNIMERLLSCTSEILLSVITRGILYDDAEWEKLRITGIDSLYKVPLYIDDSGIVSVSQIEVKCKQLIAENNIDIIFIDYLQLITADKGRYRDEEVSKIMQSLKQLAKNIDIPVVVISQLSRAVETRKEGAKIPQLSDLRDSGAIEQTADVVMFLYRPEYYDITCNELGESNLGETYLKIAKNRLGPLDTIRLKALLHIQKFVDAEDTPFDFYEDENPLNKRKWSDHFDDEAQKFKITKPTDESPF